MAAMYQDEEMQIGRFSLALQVCMTPRNDTSMAESDNEEGSYHQDYQGNNAAVQEEKKEEELPCDVSQEIMTFDVEVAENEIVDSGRTVSDLCGLDSRRSLSEILNEGELASVNEEELTINNRV